MTKLKSLNPPISWERIKDDSEPHLLKFQGVNGDEFISEIETDLSAEKPMVYVRIKSTKSLCANEYVFDVNSLFVMGHEFKTVAKVVRGEWEDYWKNQ